MKDRLVIIKHFVESIEQWKTKIWYQMNLIPTNSFNTQFSLTVNIIPWPKINFAV